jgi:hypothetical protein
MCRVCAAVACIFWITVGCAPGKRIELTVAGTKAVYIVQTCKPGIKWDGFNVTIEGLQYPDEKDSHKFSVGKINFSQQAIRQINTSVYYYDGLLVATCQTLNRLNTESSIIAYSKHRDAIVERLANYLAALEKSQTDEDVNRETEAAKSNMEAEKKTFEAKQKI